MKLRQPTIRAAVRFALVTAAAATTLSPAYAAEPESTSIETVLVTGSAIRRLDGETSLPVQILDAQAIRETGAATVVDLIQRLPTIQGATVEAASIGGSTFGFAGVSVHNVGESRTLVLLNGRRLAQFGGQTLTGFGAAIDLNSIPIAAIERVEILTDGASALYGSDAVAGVINFITRSAGENDVSVSHYAPQDDAGETGVSITAGFGDYEADGYSVFVAFAADQRDELNAVDRDFADTAFLEFTHEGRRWRASKGSPRNIPANAVADNGVHAGEAISPDLIRDGVCPDGSGQVGLACYFDYVPHIQIYPERERRTATAGVDVALGEQNLFVDALWSRNEQIAKTAPVPGELLIQAGSSVYDAHLAPLRDENGEPFFVDDAVASYRAMDLGQRINEDRVEFYHVVAGLEGLALGWDYNFALTQSQSDAKGYIEGYPGALAFRDLLASGVVDPFVGPEQQSPAGAAGLESINYRGYWNGGVSQLQTAEVRASRELFDLPNGNPLRFAAGLSYYTEEFEIKPSDYAQANLDDPVAGTPAAGGPGTGDQRFGDASAVIPYAADRSVYGAFTEVVAQAADWLELTGSVRFDDYDDVGSTTNYKASFRITPSSELLIRGSYGTGFHAPTVPQLNAALQYYGVTANPYDCSAELQAIATSLGAICRPPQTQYDVFAGGNTQLEPEKSQQATLGVVFEPAGRFSFGADYWWVGIEDAFGQVVETEAFANPTAYPDAWTTFTDIGTGATYIAYNQTNINTGKEYYSGVDLNLQGRWSTPIGTVRTQAIATYMIENRVQLREGGEYYENIGDYSSDLDVVTFRWVGRLLTTLDAGAWSHTLTVNFRSGYRDVETTAEEIDAAGQLTGEVADVRLDVDAYYTFDWQSRWRPREWLDVTLGLLNVADKDPPLSLTGSNFQYGYDARYYDPRGRVLFGKVSFKF